MVADAMARRTSSVRPTGATNAGVTPGFPTRDGPSFPAFGVRPSWWPATSHAAQPRYTGGTCP